MEFDCNRLESKQDQGRTITIFFLSSATTVFEASKNFGSLIWCLGCHLGLDIYILYFLLRDSYFKKNDIINRLLVLVTLHGCSS